MRHPEIINGQRESSDFRLPEEKESGEEEGIGRRLSAFSKLIKRAFGNYGRV